MEMTASLKPNMMIWSMLVQRQGVDDQAAINRIGYPDLILRSDTEPAMLAFPDAVIRELKERFGVRAIFFFPRMSMRRHKKRIHVSKHA